MVYMLLLAAQHVRQVVFTHRLGQRQASVMAARVVDVGGRISQYSPNAHTMHAHPDYIPCGTC
jgi:hypothetical protein